MILPPRTDGASYPTITANFSAGALGDYLGVPPGVANTVVSALPFRAYNLIFNEFYRDQDLTSERAMVTTGGADGTTAVTLAKVAWEKDYFTSARPWPQKGPEVTLPLGTSAIVKTSVGDLVTAAAEPLHFRTQAGGGYTGGKSLGVSGNTPGVVQTNDTAVGANPVGGYPSNLYADLSDATSASVNDVRRAMALQRYQEARAQYGSRYSEYLRFLGVRS